jgi:hypothetical protein
LLDYDKETKDREVILTVYSAQSYLDSSQDANAGGALRDKIVLIGGSYTDGGDIHATPLDDMPGGLVVLNAIHSLLQHGEIKPLSYWENFGWTVLSLVIVGFLFVLIGESFWWYVVTGTITIVSIPLSVFFLGEGIWINFAFPLLAIHIHQIAQVMSQLKWMDQQTDKVVYKLTQQINPAQLAKKIERSVSAQIHEFVMNKLSEQSGKQQDDKTKESHTDDSTASNVPSQKTNSDDSDDTNVAGASKTEQTNESFAQPYQKKTTESEDVESERSDNKTSQDDFTVQNVPFPETITPQEEATKSPENKT